MTSSFFNLSIKTPSLEIYGMYFWLCFAILFLNQGNYSARSDKVVKICFTLRAYSNLCPNFNNHIKQSLHFLCYQY